MNAAADLDLQSIPDRIQSEVQRAIQRSIKGVEYIASSGPSLGSTPKDILQVRGTMNLYHYRPISDEIYRVPILIVMATTNRGYILDMVPGQSFIEFLLKRGYDVYMLDWTAPKPEEKSLRMEDYVLDFIPDCVSRVQRAIQRSIKGVEYISSAGPSLGSTPKDVLQVRGTMNLYHYRPISDEIYRVPILIVMATTNRGYILDMVPGQSFIEFLLKRGYDVYMLDWTAPKPEEKSLRMEDYVLDFIPDCVSRVQRDSGETDVTVIGYCFGGVLSLLYGSIFADGPMKNLICFTTPVDFREMKLFQNFSDRRYFDVDRLVDSVGNVPPEMILSSFEMLRPASRAASQLQLWENIWNDEYVKSYRMFDRWATDTLPLAGEYFRTITKDLMWDNKLYDDTMSVGGRAADISKIKVPILHAVAEHDHIVPYDAAKPLIQKIGSIDKEEVMLKGGHVSLVAGANAIKRLWPKLDSWLGERST